MTNRFGIYVLTDFNGMRERIAALKPAWVVLHDGEAKREHVEWLHQHSPDTKIVARLYRSDSAYTDDIRRSPSGAAEGVAHAIHSHELAGKGVHWLTVNEILPGYSDLALLNEFTLNLQSKTQELLLLYSTAVENLSWDRQPWAHSLMAYHSQLYPSMRKGLERGDIYGAHQYNAPRLLNPGAIEGNSGLSQDDVRIFRYEQLVWPRLPNDLKHLPVLISEFGWDHLLWPEHTRKGLHHRNSCTSATDAANQLTEFSNEWDRRYRHRNGPPVVGWIGYCGGDSGGWGDYRWDIKGGNLDEPLLDVIIEKRIGAGWEHRYNHPTHAHHVARTQEVAQQSGSPDMDETLRSGLLKRGDELQTINLNPKASLQKRIFADGFVPVENEGEFIHSDETFTIQKAESLRTGESWLYFVKDGIFDSVYKIPYKEQDNG